MQLGVNPDRPQMNMGQSYKAKLGIGGAALAAGIWLASAGLARGDMRIGATGNLNRIPPLAADVPGTMLSPKAEVSLARNEYEAVQLGILADKSALTGITVAVSDLKLNGTVKNKKAASTSLIASKNISIRREEYIQGTYKRPPEEWDAILYDDPSAKDGRQSSWPEILRELDAPLDLESGAVLPLWVQVYVPPKTPAGIYNGSIQVRATGQPAVTVPLKVRVWDFDLPKETHLRSTFHIWDESLLKYHGGGDIKSARFQKVRRAYVDFYLKHRVNPFMPASYPVDMKFVRRANGEIDIDFTEFDKQMQHAFDNGLNAFHWPGQTMMYPQRQSMYTGGPYIWDEKEKKYVWVEMNENWAKPDAAQRKQLEILSRKIAAHLKQKGWLDKCVAYMVGEPFKGHDEHVPGLDDFEYARQVFAWLHSIDPGIRNMTAMLHDCYSPEIGADVDIWAADTSAAFRFTQREKAEMQKKREIWTYLPGLYRIDNFAACYRIAPWYCFKYGIKGFGPFTDSTAWFTNTTNPLSTEAHQPTSSIDDWMTYPGEDGPLDTIRFNLMRDGMEDYEYLYLLKNLTTKLRKVQPGSPLVARAEKVMAADGVIRDRDPFKKGNWDYSGAEISKARAQAGELCETIGRALQAR